MFCPFLKGTGGEAPGGHAEYMLMNADATYLIPDNVSYEQAAPIFAPGIPFIVGSAGPIHNHTSAWPYLESAGWGI
jgi:D-arabinose 1-dehydrogenase-like Zn-dependent alcohol dehydrogenase